MNKKQILNLHNVTRNLHDLIKSLPAVREKGSAELLNRHLQLIAYFQKQYDALVASNSQLAHV